MTTEITIIGLILLAAIAWFLFRKLARNRIQSFVDRRKAGSRIAIPADLLEANERIPVALALTDQTIFYENTDLEAQIDLDQIEEVEYASDTTTGQDFPGSRVLRLRAHGHAFEFVLNQADAKKFETALPPHRADEPGRVHAAP